MSPVPPTDQDLERVFVRLHDVSDERREMIPLPLDKTWLRGIEAEAAAALKMARQMCPQMWGRS